MKDNTTVSSVRVFFPIDSYPPVHMRGDICPCEKSTIKWLHIYYFAVFTALKVEISLFLSQSVPFSPAFFPVLLWQLPLIQLLQGPFLTHLVLPLTTSWGDYDSSLPLLPLSKDFICSTSPFPHARVARPSLYHCCYCLFTSERGQHVSILNILWRVTVAGCKWADVDGCHSHFCEL